MNFDAIPAELKAFPNWVCWSLQERNGKKTKLPINPVTGDLAHADRPDTWSSFEAAVKRSESFDGIGFVFSENDPYFGIDMDGFIDMELVGWFGTYAEKSQSGLGCHIIGRGQLPEGKGRRQNGFEVYDRLRYFVMTGDMIHGGGIQDVQPKLDEFLHAAFPPPEDVDLSLLLPKSQHQGVQPHASDVFERIRTSAQGGKFDRLWRGDISGYPSGSEADAALLSILRFWTGGDKAESFKLFSQSALASRGGKMKSKWEARADYRESTWAAIDNGDVYQPPDAPLPPQLMIKTNAPWRRVTVEHVGEAICGTILEPMVTALIAPMRPHLPLEVGIVKALSLAGCALSGKAKEIRNMADYVVKGNRLARLRIMTAGGQVANFWTLLSWNSGSGKDVGNLLQDAAISRKWLIGTAGSEEGVADAYIQKPNGLLCISEMMNWLDKRHWQSKAAGFLTGAFNAGWFSHAMSRRGDAPGREADYCFPNIYASVQPGVLQQFATSTDLESGFMGRFLVASPDPGYVGVPVCSSLDHHLDSLVDAIRCMEAKVGEIAVPESYSLDLMNMFKNHMAEPQPTWRRLSNEYYARLAVLLSIKPGDDSPTVTITTEGWQKAAIMVQWFFSNAETVFGNLHFDPAISKFENLCGKVLEIVRSAKDGKIMRSQVHYKLGRGTRSREREEAFKELQDRQLITMQQVGAATYLVSR